MNRLDRYFFFSLVKLTFAGVILALTLLLSLQAIRLGPIIVRTGIDLPILSKMVAGLSLSFTPFVIPIAFLFASLALFGRLSSDRELIALQGMGHSPWRLMRPCFIAGLVLSILTLYCALELGPQGNRLFERGIDEAFQKRGANILRPGTFNEEFLDRVLYVGENGEGGRFKKVFVFDKSSFLQELVISAQEAKWNPPNEMKWAQLQLFNGIIVSKDLEKNIIRRINFDEYRENADFRHIEGKSRDSMESQNLAGLLEKRRNQSDKIETVRRVWVECARRFWISISFFFFIPFTFIVSLRNQRSAHSRVILTGILVAAVYFGIYFGIVTWVAKSPLMIIHDETLIWLLVSLPNFMLAIVALKLIERKFGRAFVR